MAASSFTPMCRTPRITKRSTHLRTRGGVDSEYDGRCGFKGNDGTIYALSSVLLLANELLETEQTQDLVKEQLDILLRKFIGRTACCGRTTLPTGSRSRWIGRINPWKHRRVQAPERVT